MSSDYRTPVVEYHGHVPCIEPHVLGAYLDKLDKLRPRLTLLRVIAKLAELRRRFLP